MKLIFVILLSLFFIAEADSQSSYFSKGKRIELEARGDKIAVILNSDLAALELKERMISEIVSSPNEIKRVFDNVYLYTFSESKSASELQSLITNASVSNPFIKFATPVYYGESRRVSQIPTDEFVVRLNSSTGPDMLERLNQQYNVSIVGNVGNEKGFLLKSNNGVKLNALELSDLYFRTGFFEYAEPNFVYPEFCLLNSTPNDQFFSKQWALRNTGQLVSTGGSLYGDAANVSGLADADIDADLAWDITTGSNLIKIGVFDTGIDSTHPDFNQAGHLIRGYDAVYNKYGVPKDSGNFGGHGTCAAGLVGALANNGVGVAGVAPGCQLMSFRIFSITGASTSVGIARAFDTARVIGIDVLSNSWNGFTENSTVTNAIDNAALYGRGGKGCVIFFAAGNDGRGSPWYPSYLPNVVSVGASTNFDQKKAPGTGNQFNWGSNYGENEFGDLDVVAPTICYTTDIQGVFGYVNIPGTAGNYYANFPGTSAACPQAAGIAALMLSVNADLSRTDVMQRLYQGCDKIENTSYTITKPYGKWSPYLGYGRVNAYNSVQLALGMDVTPPTISHKNIHSHSSTYPTHIVAEIQDQNGSPVPASGDLQPKLIYRTKKHTSAWSSYDSLTADAVELNRFTFTIPCLGYETQVQYYLKAFDNSGNMAVFPRGAPNSMWLCYFAIGIPVTKTKTIGPFACLDGGNVTTSPEAAFDDFIITDSYVQIFMQQERISDAIIQLYSPLTDPNINRKCLFASNGGTGMNITGAVVSDSASAFWYSGTPPYQYGSFKADYFMSGLNGTNAAGNWRILHYDQFYGYVASYDSIVISLTGNSGVPSPSIRFDSAEDSVLSFNSPTYPDSSVKDFYIVNCGNSELVISSLNFTGEFASKFALAGPLPQPIAPNDSGLISVVLRTSVPDHSSGIREITDAVENSVMEIISNDPSKPLFRVSLQTDSTLPVVSLLNLKVLLQGMYDANADTTATDTVTVYLRNSSFPYERVDSSRAVLRNDARATFVFENVPDSVLYFIEISHRNSIETWSAAPGQMFVNRRLVFDMTFSVAMALGDNLIQVSNSPERFAVYSGDVNRDGFIDGTDLQLIDNDANLLSAVYLSTDLNGDYFVDGTDALIAGNNAALFVGIITL
jgi:subtilisin family serine protease